MNEILQNIYCNLYEIEEMLQNKQESQIVIHKVSESKALIAKLQEQWYTQLNDNYHKRYEQKCIQEDQWKHENEKLHHQIQLLGTNYKVFQY